MSVSPPASLSKPCLLKLSTSNYSCSEHIVAELVCPGPQPFMDATDIRLWPGVPGKLSADDKQPLSSLSLKAVKSLALQLCQAHSSGLALRTLASRYTSLLPFQWRRDLEIRPREDLRFHYRSRSFVQRTGTCISSAGSRCVDAAGRRLRLQSVLAPLVCLTELIFARTTILPLHSFIHSHLSSPIPDPVIRECLQTGC